MRTIQNRPQTIKDMAGHTVLLKEMKERSKENTFENHMLFAGQSGSGKSTLALNLAKLLNCKNPVVQEDGSREPCNQCRSCRDVIDQTYNRDVYYMDATYMGKQEVQNLHDKVTTRPLYDKNKVFIIDEAHLLNSKEARGGMLTLTEKKKDNVYFILCTTDNSKFDDAFRSRFAQYRFKAIGNLDIGEYLAGQLQKETDNYDEEYIETLVVDILPLITENANGSIRQGMQLLERVLATGLTDRDEVSKELGLVSEEQIYKMIDYLLYGNPKMFFEGWNYFEDKEYVFNYVSKALVSTKKQAIGYGEAIKSNFIKEKNEVILTGKATEFEFLFKTFQYLIENTGYRFNERLFEYSILRYFENITSMPKLHRRESQNDTKKKRRKVVE